MIHKEFKNLSRRELVDIIYQMKKNEQKLQAEIDSLREALQEKRIRLAEAGSIADAAVSITDILTAAQKTADLYLQEIACMKAETEKVCEKMLEEARNNSAGSMADSAKPQDDDCLPENVDYTPLQSEIHEWEKIIVRELLEDGGHGQES